MFGPREAAPRASPTRIAPGNTQIWVIALDVERRVLVDKAGPAQTCVAQAIKKMSICHPARPRRTPDPQPSRVTIGTEMQMPRPSRNPLVSFVVPAYNEQAFLPATLRAIHAAVADAGVEYEIVVADDASTDLTPRIAESLEARVVRVEHRQIAATRNAGARFSRGAMLMFVDADTIITPKAVRRAIDSMQAGAVGGSSPIAWDGRIPLYARILTAPVMLAYRVFGFGTGAFLFCTREAFDAAGGFDETLYAAEEVLFARSLRAQGRFAWLRDCPVLTSARKLRTHSGLEIMAHLWRFTFGGLRGLQSRAHKDLWYASERRVDPHQFGTDVPGSAHEARSADVHQPQP